MLTRHNSFVIPQFIYVMLLNKHKYVLPQENGKQPLANELTKQISVFITSNVSWVVNKQLTAPFSGPF